ncbi:MAG: XRE family transcriptional regulator [Pseudonocardia sediminis]
MTGDQPDTTANRERQRELYGAPMSDRVHRLTGALGVTQARLAATLGMSPAMLSQLVSGRRVKIGDPAVLTRLMALDERVARGPVPPEEVPALLEQAHAARLQWSAADDAARTPAPAPVVPAPRRVPSRPAPTADDALRGVSAPARLVAAAAALAPSFPEIAEVLRRAASRPVR